MQIFDNIYIGSLNKLLDEQSNSLWNETLYSPCDVILFFMFLNFFHIDGLAQNCGNSSASASALELPQSRVKPSIWR